MVCGNPYVLVLLSTLHTALLFLVQFSISNEQRDGVVVEKWDRPTIVCPRSEVLTQTINNFATRAGTGLKLGQFKSSH